MAQRMPAVMPEAHDGWTQLQTGHLTVLFHPNRRQEGRDDDIVRTTIVVGVPGKETQVLRFDPFSVGGHFHVSPTGGDDPNPDTPRPFRLRDGERPLDVALAYFEEPDLLRELLRQANEPEAAAAVTDEELQVTARQIREVLAA
ncbi:MAG: hypothetical protein HY471_00430 [Candidatus Sungbacteria bacterium]|nr:hypothetical protein [Candidatus Sungbacteria bacterium]